MAFDSGDNRIVRPDMGALPGFVGQKGFQGAHVLGEVTLGGRSVPQKMGATSGGVATQ
ncbi:hypothetical protein OEZ60_00570 [Defluviimonas sp. WL0024]|uniref:Uncharacterized protein n=1 Tax=Albidovulum salinarum TaxID=2984153 RepID=A0ABT2WXT8_9RHOB|nr:hypothetical protein [Defluviimonas sp. WL0024]MCU9846497.1 hypothetical protein [Defluviimonas sp. WL0024]